MFIKNRKQNSRGRLPTAVQYGSDGIDDQRTADTLTALRAAAHIARPAAMAEIIGSMIGFNNIRQSSRQRFYGAVLFQTDQQPTVLIPPAQPNQRILIRHYQCPIVLKLDDLESFFWERR